MRLRIFADRTHMLDQEKHVVMLYPFWGPVPDPPGDKDEGRFDEYSREGGQFFSLASSIAESDIAVLPFEWRSRDQWKSEYGRYHEHAKRIAEDAGRVGKRLIVFFNSDSDESVPVPNSVIFRTSMYRSRQNRNEHALPGWSVDFLPKYLDGRLPVRGKAPDPVVGYCGYVDYLPGYAKGRLRLAVKAFLGHPKDPGRTVRGSAARAILRDKRIRTQFIIRKGFGGHFGDALRREYVDNMVQSDYCLVSRGAGNFSYRLYEVLSCGRIPLFVDTDCVLPYDHLIDWKNIGVWVSSDRLGTIGEAVVAFHRSISVRDFEELQRSNRGIYEEWIRPVGFFRNLWRCL